MKDHFDRLISEFGNTAEILQAAHEDLSKENQAAAAEDYGRGVSLHESCDYREAALKEQIALLINRGNHMSCFVDADRTSSRELWDKEVTRARELIK